MLKYKKNFLKPFIVFFCVLLHLNVILNERFINLKMDDEMFFFFFNINTIFVLKYRTFLIIKNLGII